MASIPVRDISDISELNEVWVLPHIVKVSGLPRPTSVEQNVAG